MTLRTGEDILIWRRRLWIALYGGIVLEEALDLSSDRILNEWTEDVLCRIITRRTEECLWNRHFDRCTWNSAAQSEHTLCISMCKGTRESAHCRNCKCPTRCCTTFFFSKNMLWLFYMACFCVGNTVTTYDMLLNRGARQSFFCTKLKWCHQELSLVGRAAYLIKGFITEGHIKVFFCTKLKWCHQELSLVGRAVYLIKGFITEGHIKVFFVQNWSDVTRSFL